jgi:hypothetical protein
MNDTLSLYKNRLKLARHLLSRDTDITDSTGILHSFAIPGKPFDLQYPAGLKPKPEPLESLPGASKSGRFGYYLDC